MSAWHGRSHIVFVLGMQLLVASAPVVARQLEAQGKDSAEVLRRARDAQSRFERYRIRHLPTAIGYGRPRCDEVIGRFCFWHDDDAEKPPPEPYRIRAARDSLIALLDQAATTLAGDAWIAGQRVRYLVEQERSEEALAAARACGAEPWWCRALEGLALHTAGDFEAANVVYDLALAEMPDEERCAWNDISLLLDEPVHKRYEKMGCAERRGLEERFWWLAQPLHLIPGNDVRSEHFARLTTARIEERARTAHSLRWGDDLLELRVRYGWPTEWSRERPSTASMNNGPHTVGHEPSPSFYFLPSAAIIEQPLGATEKDWELHALRPRHRYAPSYARHFGSLEHQTALFRRGDSLLVVAAYDVTRDTVLAQERLTAGLVLSGRDPAVRVVSQRDSVLDRQTLVATAPDRPMVLSLEVMSVSRKGAARARHAIQAPAGGAQPHLSELLLFEPREELPSSLTEVLPFVLGSLKLRQGTSVGLYWEMYGYAATAPLVATLDVEPLGRPALRRAVEALGLAAKPTRVKMRWQDGPSSVGNAVARTLAVRLASLRRGRYLMRLTVTGSGAPLTVTREIEILETAED